MPPVSGEDLIGALQSELPIPISISELPRTGVLGLCVNLITIVRHDEVDPVEHILRAFEEEGFEAACFPGSPSEAERGKQMAAERVSIASSCAFPARRRIS